MIATVQRGRLSPESIRPLAAAYWRLNESGGSAAADSSGNAHGGTYTGTFTLNQPGGTSDGQPSVLLDGTTGRVTTTFNPFALASPLTLLGWAKRSTSTSGDALCGSDSATGMILRLNSGGNTALFAPATGGASVTWANASPGNNIWFFWALTWTGASKSATYYLNAVSLGAQTIANDFSATPGNFVIGADRVGATDPFDGYVQKVAVFSSLLTAAEIARHYAAGGRLRKSGLWTP